MHAMRSQTSTKDPSILSSLLSIRPSIVSRRCHRRWCRCRWVARTAVAP
uniref:Uncharacterized protein n=1 Tax=Arundo donax TaxID=35708 RepID=A0A0A9DIL6_ARUDO